MIKKRLMATIVCFIWLSVFAESVVCDTPPEPPGDRTIYSLNHQFLLFSDYKQKRTSVFKLNKKGQRTKLWEMPGWFDGTALANDGEHFVVIHALGGLLDLDYKPDAPLFTFYHRGAFLNRVALNQLYADPRPESLERTVSHYAWSRMHGFNEKNHFVVTTVDEREFIFAADTGQPVNAKLFTPQAASVSSTTGTSESNVANANRSNTGKATDTSDVSRGCFPAFACLACMALVMERRGRS